MLSKTLSGRGFSRFTVPSAPGVRVTLATRPTRTIWDPIQLHLRWQNSWEGEPMKLHFEPNLDSQLQAIEAVCDLFRGQEVCRTDFTVTRQAADTSFLPEMGSDLGVGNRLTLLDDELREEANFQVQQRRTDVSND